MTITITTNTEQHTGDFFQYSNSDQYYYTAPPSSYNGSISSISYSTWQPSIFSTHGICGYCNEIGYNLDIGVLICRDCLKKSIDKILNPIDINRKAIDALKFKDN